MLSLFIISDVGHSDLMFGTPGGYMPLLPIIPTRSLSSILGAHFVAGPNLCCYFCVLTGPDGSRIASWGYAFSNEVCDRKSTEAVWLIVWNVSNWLALLQETRYEKSSFRCWSALTSLASSFASSSTLLVDTLRFHKSKWVGPLDVPVCDVSSPEWPTLYLHDQNKISYCWEWEDKWKTN